MKKVGTAGLVVVSMLGMVAVPAGAAKPTSPPGNAPITPPGQPANPGQPADPGSGNPGSPVELSIGDATVGEDVGSAVLTLSLSTTSSFPTTVDWATSNDSATAGSDYETSGGTATIPSGSTTATVSVPVFDDPVAESTEAFAVILGTASANATITDGTATVTITDDDAATSPTLSVEDISVIEGFDAQVTIRLSQDATDSVNISGQVHAGTATFPEDFLAFGFTTGMLPGQDHVVVSVPTYRSNDVEGADGETFNVTIDATQDADIADATGVVTIIEDPQAGNTTCLDDGFEENDDEEHATDTGDDLRFTATARLCDNESVDVYSIPESSGQTVRINVLYDTSVADLGVILTQGDTAVVGQQFTDLPTSTNPFATSCPRDDTSSTTESERTGECIEYTIPTDPGGPIYLAISGGPDGAGIPYQIIITEF